MHYKVRAIDQQGKLHELFLSATGSQELFQQLSEDGLEALSTVAYRSHTHAQLSRTELGQFLGELATLLDAGLSAPEALEVICDHGSDGQQAELATKLKTQLQRGSSFSEALRRSIDEAPSLLLAMTRANESTGLLADAFRQYSKLIQESDAIRRRSLAAVTYPAILLIASVLVLSFLLGFVVPRFAASFGDSGQKLPWASQALFALSTGLREFSPTIIGVLLLCLIATLGVVKKMGWTNVLDSIMRTLPGVRALYHQAIVARLLLTTGSLIESGLTVLEALTLSKATLPLHWHSAVEASITEITLGSSTSSALKEVNLVLPISGRLLQIGEHSGGLAAQMKVAAAYHEQALGQSVDRFLRLAEPLMLAFIGLIVGGVVVLLYLPIFEIAQWSRR